MLKNSKTGYNRMFQIINGYYNWIFPISVALSLECVCVFACVYFFFYGVSDNRKNTFLESSTVYMGCLRTRSG